MRNPVHKLLEWSDAQSFGGIDAYRRFQQTGSIEPPEPIFDAGAHGLLFDRDARVYHPTVQRPLLYPIVESENGHICLHPRDWQSAMLVIGAQGTGKSSLVLRHYLNAAQDRRGAVVLIDPKRTLALRALAYTPWLCGKRVWYLNLRRPAFGMSPMRLNTSAQAVMNVVVDALTDAFPDQLFQASREIIQNCVLAALALAEAEQRPPRIEDVYHLLVWDNEALRNRAIAACSRLPNGDLVRDYLGRQVPSDMQRAPSDMSSRLRAPRNKLSALLQAESLRVFFNHTTEKSLEEIIADRDILIVDADLGEGGRENARVVIHFILHMLDSVLLRQQGMARDELSHVHLILDEAGHLLNEHIMGMVDTHREAGLDVLAAMHYMDQLELRVLKGALNLFRQKYIFRISESGDSRRLAEDISNLVHDSVGNRGRADIWPDAPKDLSNTHCLVSHLIDGKPSDTFLGRTYRMADHTVEGWRPTWLAWLADQVGEYPEQILWAMREQQRAGEADSPPDGAAAANRQSETPDPAANNPPRGPKKPSARQKADSGPSARRRGEIEETAASPRARLDVSRRLAQSAGLSVSRTRLELAACAPLGVDPAELVERDGVSAPRAIAELAFIDRILLREKDPVADEQNTVLPRLNDKDLAALAALDKLGLMTVEQLRRLIWHDTEISNAQKRIRKLASAGLVHRYALQLDGQRGGRPTYLFAIAPKGLHAAQHPPQGRRPTIHERRQFRTIQATAGSDLRHDLIAASWLISFHQAFGEVMGKSWRTPRYAAGHLDPPRLAAGRRGEPREMTMLDAERALEEHYCFADVKEPRPLKPDASIELRLPHQGAGGERETVIIDLLVEVDNTGRPDYNLDKLRAYDALLCGWSLSLKRYQTLRARPFCLFVSPTIEAMGRLMRAADTAMTGAVGIKGTPDPSRWYHAGRDHIAFTAQELIHYGVPSAWMLPPHPPATREKLGDVAAYKATPVSLIDPRSISKHAMHGWEMRAGRAVPAVVPREEEGE
jgi:hypothetical protein